MQTIAIGNRRGGTGKTVTAFALAAGLRRKGYKVLLIDLDSQTNLTYDTAAEIGKYSSMDLLTGAAAAERCIVNGDIIPAEPALAGADLLLTGKGKELKLRTALKPISKKYDFAILDLPPALGMITTNALTAADKLIIPAQAEIHSLQGIGLLYRVFTSIKESTNPDLTLDGILLTRYNGRSILSQDMKESLENMAAEIGTRVYSTPIRECVAIKESQAMRTDIFEYAPRSNAAKDYAAFIEEFLEGRT